MIHSEMSGAEEAEKIKQSVEDSSFSAFVIGGSILAGAIIISASLIYSFGLLAKNLTGTNLVAGTQVVAGAQPTNGQQAAAVPSAPINVKLTANTPFLGSASAKVTVVEYADYRCPFCERVYTNVIPELKTKYINTGKIKFVYQDFAFLGPDSNTAAEASHCAVDQNKFWQFHDYLFDNQGSESGDWASASHQKEFAQKLGLNTTQFNQCLDGGKYKKEVLDETAAGRSYGVTGTPSFVIVRSADTSIDLGYIQAQLQQQKNVITLPNGNIFLVGAQPASAFIAAIDSALSK